jgi:hypothetical protein
MPDEEEQRRYSSGKAIAATFILFGVVLTALFIFIVVLIQRAC